MYQPQFAAIGQRMAAFKIHMHATKMMVNEIAGEFVVVARDKYHFATLAGFTQKFLHHIVMRLRPIPFFAQLPAVNNVAD